MIDRVARTIAALRPGHPVGLRRQGGQDRQRVRQRLAFAVSTAWSGRKHERPIVLEPWQRSIVEKHPAEFLQGSIESDGCRHRRVVGGRNYPAYAFTNHSSDILQIFVWACGLIGLRPRRANRVTVSLARRADVAIPDDLFATEKDEAPSVGSASLVLTP